MTSQEQIEGKVARVLSRRELAINRGWADGVREGMRFAVLRESGESIRDPDTGHVLGTIVRPKVEVEVFSLQEHLALARTFRKRRVNVGGVGIGDTGRLFEPPKYETRYESMKTEELAEPDSDDGEKLVRTGDRVMQIGDEATAYLASHEPLETAGE